MKRLLTISIVCSLLIGGCQKPAVEFDFEVIQLPVDDPVRSVYVVGDSLIAVGGAIGEKGFVVAGNVQVGSFVLIRNDLKRELYAVDRQGSTWYVTGDSLLVYRGPSIETLEQMFWRREDWVSDLSNHPIRSVVFDSTGILMVGGGKLAFGVLFHSYDGGGFWSPIEPENELRCAEISDGYAWVGGNGILMRSLWGTGEWERLRLEDHFITDILFYNSLQGLALTEKGSVLESDDGGTSWTRVYQKRAPSMRAMDSDGEAVVCVGDQGVLLYRSGEVAEWQIRRFVGHEELYDVKIYDGRCYIATGKGQVITFLLEALK